MPQISRFRPFEMALAPYARFVQVLPQQYLIGPGEDIDQVFYLKSGFCRFSMLQEDGKELILSFHGPGSLYPVKCRQFHFTLEPVMLYQAVTAAEVWVLEPKSIEALVRSNPDFAVAAVDFHTVHSNMYSTRQALHTQMDMKSKIAAFLYLYAQSQGAGRQVALNQDQVAAVLGVSRVQVARAYRSLRSLGAIASYRNGVQILDWQLLKGLCDSNLVD